jgi:hypothetical protein
VSVDNKYDSLTNVHVTAQSTTNSGQEMPETKYSVVAQIFLYLRNQFKHFEGLFDKTTLDAQVGF